MPKVILATTTIYGFEPLGLGCLKAWARRDQALRDVEIEILSPPTGTPLQDLATEVLSREPLLIGLSCHVWNVTAMCALAKLLKEAAPAVPIVMGGPETIEPARIFASAPVDFIVPGEGEESFRRILRSVLLARGSLREIPGVAFIDEKGALVRNPDPPLIDLSLLPSVYQEGIFPEDTPMVSRHLEGSRGCPIGCSFCDWGPLKMRYVPLDRLRADFQTLAPQTEIIVMTDADLLMRRSHGVQVLRTFLEATGNSSCRLSFHINPVFLSDEALEIIAANPKKFLVEFGIQTINPEVLRLVGRPFEPARVECNLKRFSARAPQSVSVLQLIIGLPNDTLESFRRTLDWALQFGASLGISRALVLPGTPLARDAGKLGIDFSPIPPYETIRTPTMTPDDFREALRLADAVHFFTSIAEFFQVFQRIARRRPRPGLSRLWVFDEWLREPVEIPEPHKTSSDIAPDRLPRPARTVSDRLTAAAIRHALDRFENKCLGGDAAPGTRLTSSIAC